MTFMKSKLLKIFIWIPAVICAVMIFGFSGQNGENSGNLSRKAAGVIVDIADRDRKSTRLNSSHIL